jgi:hypothetical protein
MHMSRNNPWNPLGRNNPLAGGKPERSWLAKVHGDNPQPDQEKIRQNSIDVAKQTLKGKNDSNLLEQHKMDRSFMERAGKFVRKVAELATLGQIPLADQMLFHDWLHRDGKNLDLNRATYLASQEQYYYQQYYQESAPHRAEEAEIHFLKDFLKKLSQIGDDDGEHEHKHNHNRKKKMDENEEALEAYEAGKQEGEQEAHYHDKRYRDSYYRNKEKLENDPNNDPLG